MQICTNEVFGPVMTIYTFSTEDEAMELANSSGYGLGSCVFTNDSCKGERVMQNITSGMCNLNDFAVNYLCQSLPFGGRGISGFDRFAGVEGLRGNTVARAVTTDRIPGVKTDIPPMLNYPMKLASTDFVEGLCSMMYENGAVSRLLGLKRLLLSMLPNKMKKQ
jgi:aldehyde dehydrogenase (NAD+)